ncbi:MAG: ABC transporter ATP-binding protein [Caldilineaceae bacterium]|uniref:ABC transporter ATP-binding protein n=1 Tax=Caldilineaceae bacterium SB0675_bin_29 TaxID=2605266 RepID=A0A6B1G2V9_9CHLR|nr:ABC transporter ATP-binding protein [Caldilineaceae bacterium]MYH63843.1 ABC transporter ATP-binding protein [Caldilineaceae bacterium SB0675_bin_29]
MEQQEPVLELKDLHTYFPLEEGLLKAVNGVSLTIHKNRTLGVVGESGCGKSVTAQSILRIVPTTAQMAGEILLHQNGRVVDLAALTPSGNEIRDIRGRDISMIFQEPMTAFSPVHTVGDQIMEAILVHDDDSKGEARSRAIELLSLVGIPIPEERVDAYPHQLSGGMRQRAMIAMALALKPKLLIADEPTTALDVTIQAQILRLMKTLQAEIGMSIMFITHDLGVIANMADEVAVMYLGRVVEYGSVRQIFRTPQHPYTQALMRSIPRAGRTARERLQTIQGIVPVPLDPPDICPFADRCEQFIPGRCDESVPEFLETEPGHSVRCILYE